MDKKEVTAQITCPCCSSFLRDPRLLPCLHSLCLECVTRCSRGVLPSAPNSATSSSLTCPVCQFQAAIPQGGFPVDLWKRHLLDLAPLVAEGGTHKQPGTTTTTTTTTTAAPPPECVECGSHDVPWWCPTCGVFLCNDDKAHHSRARKTASHNVVTVDQIRTQTSVTPAAPKPALCSKHPHEELRLYCNTDKSLICRDCTLIDHKNHDFVFSSDLSSKFKENIASLCSKLSLRLEKLSLSKHTAIGCCKNADELSENVEAEIRTEFAKIVAVVNAKEAQLLSELKTITETSKKIFQEHIEGCDNKMKDAQEAQEYAQQATTRFTDLQLVAVNDTLTSRVKKLCDSGAQNDSLAPNELKVRFECDSTAVCGTISSSLGRLVHNSTSGSLVPKAATRELNQLGSMVTSTTPRQAQKLFVDNTTGKVYWGSDYYTSQLTEFESMTSFINNTNPRQFTVKDVPNHPGGTYQAVHNGHVYCTPANAATMTKVRVSDGSTVATAPLPNAGHSGESPWTWNGYTDICWYVDAGGVLYVVHAPPNNGNIHITRVDPDSLTILQTWTVPRIKMKTGFAFVVCGRFYFGKAYDSGEIDGVFDTTTGVYDGTYRNTLPTFGKYVRLTSWIPSTNQLIVVDAPDSSGADSEFRVFLIENVAL
ncbi:E3 ubiquitin-protein ligase TRIM71 [Pelomyxa schiedti]|nr:E3 ubiquitin-protein ligase TRIM71 [Pelomyxa schiedti]